MPEQHEHKFANRLSQETSPYLLQHAHNPVDWYPWNDEALQKSKDENKPILLSIGYSACHWCHVMERESFENEEIAAIMNKHFVNIKVDREERPDLDSIYMDAVQAMTGHGGWPMTVFLTSDGEPFYGGTYFPPAPRQGMPGFPQVLEGVVNAYRDRPDEVTSAARNMVERLRSTQQMTAGDGPLNDDLLEAAYRQLRGNYDPVYGGFGPAPKFPQAMGLEFLLHYWYKTGNEIALNMVEQTLQFMARGGMYDQLGGGFHRYSVDQQWLVPHFEKMLYDNALLVRVYLQAYQVTGKLMYAQVVEETLDYVRREMTDPGGAFFSAQDADSEGEEGKFFVWTPAEIRDVLGEADATILMDYYAVTESGNFEGHNIFHCPREADVIAYRQKIDEEALAEIVARSRRKLFDVRSERVAPATDTKVLTSWSPLMIVAFAEAHRVLKRDDFLQSATDAANFLLRQMRQVDGRLLHTYRDGRAKQLGFLEDYAFLIDALLALYESTFDPHWIREAIDLADKMIALYWDEANGGFFTTGIDQEKLVTRPKDLLESSIPSGNAVAAHVLQRLAILAGRPDYPRHAVDTIKLARNILENYSSAVARMLVALSFYLGKPPEIAIIGHSDDPTTTRLVEVVNDQFIPNKVLAQVDPNDVGDLESLIPLLEAKTLTDGGPAAYVCRNYACRQPVTTPDELRAQLAHTASLP